MARINTEVIDVSTTRVNKLRVYLMTIIDNLLSNTDYQINANMLSNDINNYSLDKIPTETTVEKWIDGTTIKRDVFDFRSRNDYSQDTLINLLNVGFFELFENIIKSNSKNGILPDIEGIENIECLNCASMQNATTNSAEFDIQIQVTYKEV